MVLFFFPPGEGLFCLFLSFFGQHFLAWHGGFALLGSSLRFLSLQSYQSISTDWAGVMWTS